MCTLTWHVESQGYHLFFNRDERLERKPGLPPREQRRGRTRFVAPLDGDFGGTWLAVNEYGLSLALLNGYADPSATDSSGGFLSRGLLIPALIESRSAALALRRLERQKLDRFRSFLMLALDRSGTAILGRWIDGALSVERSPRQPLISSSFDAAAVRRSRAEWFHSLVGDRPTAPEAYLAFHESHRPERGAHSTCMHRDDACTVSFHWIEVDADLAHFRYAGHAPCAGRPDQFPVTLLLEAARQTPAAQPAAP